MFVYDNPINHQIYTHIWLFAVNDVHVFSECLGSDRDMR